MTGPPIPDAPRLPPWVLAYAEYGDEQVLLADASAGDSLCHCPGFAKSPKRFTVAAGVPSHRGQRHEPDCPNGGLPWHTIRGVLDTDDETEALAVFARERDWLAGGE